jgi:hypothetical protein
MVCACTISFASAPSCFEYVFDPQPGQPEQVRMVDPNQELHYLLGTQYLATLDMRS